jgi:hypothetical protein
VGRVQARLRIGAAMDGAQMRGALLGKEREQLALEFTVAAGLAGQMLGIDCLLGHGKTRERSDIDRPHGQIDPFQEAP